MPSISGQSILIIGGSSGIGFAVASLSLSSNVGRVAIASSNRTRIDDAVDRLKAAHPGVPSDAITGLTVDLETGTQDLEAQLTRLLTSATSDSTKPLDHIIMTAGRADMRPLTSVNAPYLQNLTSSRFLSTIFLAKLAPKYLSPGPTSSIIYTTGAVAEKPQRGLSVMTALSQAGYGLTRGLALDLAPLRVNMVSPGATETEMWGASADARRDMTKKNSLLKKVAQPEEVAEAYIYLMRNTDATGSVVGSNGGSVLQ